jgi:CRP-like cAMP-binding protein
VRTAIFYTFQRHNIEIPWPIQIQYEREELPPDPGHKAEGVERVLSRVDLVAALPAELRREVALAASSAVFGTGETIVRQDEPGQSMFVIASGAVSVVIGPTRKEVAKIEAGGVFGEMSLLTGEPRTATVLAIGDVEVIEIGADLFRRLAEANPQAIAKIGEGAMRRRAELDAARAAAAGSAPPDAASLIARMKKFLRLV